MTVNWESGKSGAMGLKRIIKIPQGGAKEKKRKLSRGYELVKPKKKKKNKLLIGEG